MGKIRLMVNPVRDGISIRARGKCICRSAAAGVAFKQAGGGLERRDKFAIKTTLGAGTGR